MAFARLGDSSLQNEYSVIVHTPVVPNLYDCISLYVNNDIILFLGELGL